MTDPELELLIIRLREELPGDVYARVQPFLQAGTELLNGGEPQHARRVFEAILDDVKDLPHSDRRNQALSVAWYNIACVACKCGQVDEEIGIYERLLERFGGERDPYVRYIVAMASVNRGVKLAKTGRLEEAARAYAEVVMRFIDAAEPETRAQAATAVVYRGVTHGLLGRPDDEMRDYDLAIALFGGDADPILRGPMAKAFYSKAMAAIRLGRHDDALRDIDELKKRFGDDGDPEIRQIIADAEEEMRVDAARMAFEAIVQLRELGESREALAACDRYMQIADVAHPNARLSRARVLLNKGVLLRDLGRMHEAVQVCDDLITAEADPALRSVVAIALRNKGNFLEEMAWPEAAVDAYTELVARFAADDQPEILEQVALARERLAALR